MRKYGLIAGFSLIFIQYISFFSGFYKSGAAIYSALAPLLVLILFIVFAQLEQRKLNGGLISFIESVKTGLGTAAIAAVLYAIGNYFFYKWINPDAIAEYAVQLQEQLRKSGHPDSQIEEKVLDYKASYPFQAAIVILAQGIAVGGLISLLSALIVKRK